MKDYDDIDFNDYLEPEEIVIEKPKSEPKKPVKSNLPAGDDIDFSDYGVESKEDSSISNRESRLKNQAGVYATEEKTPEQIRGMTLQEKMEYSKDLEREREFVGSKQFGRGVASGISLGASEYIPGLEIEDSDANSNFGQFLGETIPLVQGMKLATKAIKGIPSAYKWGTRLAKTGVAASVGSGLEATKEAIKGEGFDPLAIGLHGVAFGAGDAVIRAAVRYVPGMYNWVKGLKTSQRAQLLGEGGIPSDLDPTAYKFFQDEIVPALQDIAQEEFVFASEKATQEANTLYQKELAQTKTNHEEYLYNLAKDEKLDKVAFEEAEAQFKAERTNKIAKHEAEMEAIEAANQEAKAAFEEQNTEWERTVRRQEVVDNAIKNVQQEAAQSLEGRINPAAEDVRIRPAPGPKPATELENKVGSIISERKAPNASQAGEESFAAVRASADADHRVVRGLYKESDKLNSSIVSEHPELANELRGIIEFYDSIPQLSGPQEQAKKTAQKVLNAIMEFGEDGAAIGFKEISNEVLLEQTKVLRHFKDYDFAIGDPGAIFNPLINALESSAERAALSSGNEAAVSSLQKARSAYREWSELYNNKFIRKYRNISNHRPKKTFESSLNVDDYRKLDQVLNRTNAGQQVSAQTRRELVEKELSPFFENPRSVNKKKFNKALDELAPILKDGEEQAIRGAFNEARKTPVIQGKKLNTPNQPKEPKLKSIDRVDNIEYFKPPKPKAQEITEVKLPVRKEVKPTPEMKTAAKKMKITPEEALELTDTPTGLKELKQTLSKKEHGKELFEKIAQHKIKEIKYGGNVKQKFTGTVLTKRFNKGKNFDILSELMGEEAALDLLDSAAAIGEQEVTAKTIIKYAKKAGTVKAAILLGII